MRAADVNIKQSARVTIPSEHISQTSLYESLLYDSLITIAARRASSLLILCELFFSCWYRRAHPRLPPMLPPFFNL
jgi:hypothetical protein